MGRIVATAWITLDGFVANVDNEMDWLLLGESMMTYEQDLVDNASALLFGRSTHADFAGYWPNAATDPNEDEGTRRYARRLGELARYVVSRSGKTAEWEGTTRLETIDEQTVATLKSTHDGDIVIYGSLSVVDALTSIGAMDEYHLLVHPVFLGAGRPFFTRRISLRPLSEERFDSGVVLQRYAPASD
ncbi:dihydrofolate reductase family protein [Tenggerimyces flavus]|uniref:Dihydrofolate reductase family protein n=1 Tax=Tenggerimyces flavus TaxID=1708749 RepID=A0ABV7YBY7_9ACTN|nr:dihydrofolate reductase family protein [Tenggerimyces flavus]MBM7785605.1 dihydrofolate reductase [Tenggerimyces flavus]